MNLCVLVSSLRGGGAERASATLCNAWAAQGHTVTLVTLEGRSPDDYRLDPTVGRISLKLASASTSIAQALSANVKRAMAVRCALSTCKPDVVLGMMTTGSVIAWLASIGMRIPVVAAERIHPPTLPPGRAWHILRRLTYPRASAVVTQTALSAAWIAEHCPGSRTVVLPNALPWPLPTFDPTLPVQGLAVRRHLILAAGRLATQKGFDLLLAAFGCIAHRHPDWDLMILGDGEERARLLRQVESARLSDRVHLPGRAGNMQDWYERASLFVLSSRYEGFPNVLLEAMASGCPVISFACETGPAEIVREGVDGVLVAPRRGAEGLASEMDHLMSDDSLRATMGQRAIEVRDRFSVDHVAKLWEAMFHDIAQR